MASWISLTSLLVATLVILSLTNRVEGKRRGGVENVKKEQGLGKNSGVQNEKAKLKLKKKRLSRRRKVGKKGHPGNIKKTRKHVGKQGQTKEFAKGKGKKGKNNEKGKRNKKGKNNMNKRKLRKQAEKNSASEEEESEEEDAARQLVVTNITDPDRYNHCDYIDLVEVGYREDSTCKPGDKVIFKVSFALARFWPD